MARELAYVILTPYTLAKSRTGGVISRYLARTDLALVGARMFNPSPELVEEYANLVRSSSQTENRTTNELVADYIASEFAPNPHTGRLRRVMVLLFEGEDAVEKIWKITGYARTRPDCGETVRETYGDYVADPDGTVRRFEPAVLVAPFKDRVALTLKLWGRFSSDCGGLVHSSSDFHEEGPIQRTLVMLKPDNFRRRSLRAGSIIDVFSATGLRIVAVKKFRMTVEQAERFYGPVKQALESRFFKIAGERLNQAIMRELDFEIPEDQLEHVCAHMGPSFAAHQFERIVEFMTGYRPSEVAESDKAFLGHEECFALVYEGPNAVVKIRDILGATDPSKATPGSIRFEFGSNVMVNAAHASDSPENAEREMDIIDINSDDISHCIGQYCV
jgi:nucleoside diphosphate kinase